MEKLRVRYSKTGKARYISHLDLMTAMQRAFLRAGVSLAYSGGFNPHPYISVALPAPVGVESVCELMDIAAEGSINPEKVNRYMPEGLKVLKAYKSIRNFSDIKWVETKCIFHFDDETAHKYDIEKKLLEQFVRGSLLITKKTKRGISAFDVAPHICSVSAQLRTDNTVELSAKLSAQNPTVGLKDIVQIMTLIENDIPVPLHVEIKRIELSDKSMVLFK